MRIYEELFILRPDVTDEEMDPFVDQLQQVITGAQGTVDKLDKWGKRRLAYRVGKREEGYYILIQFTAGPDVVKELERRLRVSDLVLKYLTVRIDEKLKRIEKRKKMREKRAARKPAPQVALPAVPSPEQAMAVPEHPEHPGPGEPE